MAGPTPGTEAQGLDPAEAAILRQVEALADEIVAFTRELVRIPTVNPPGDRYAECADLVADTLADLGYGVERLAAEGLPEHSAAYPRINVVGTLPTRGRSEDDERRPTLHFNGHYDVVPASGGWSVDPFGAELRDGRIYGRGTADQKAGIAASVFAVEAVRQAGYDLLGTVEQSATPDEESGGFAGVAWLCDAGRLAPGRQDFVVITEPLDPERVCVGHRGVYWSEVTTLGSVGHGSMPGLAVSAVEAMARLLAAIERDLRPRLAARSTSAPVMPEAARRPSISVNAIHGGQPLDVVWQTPVVPDRCVVTLDRRFLPEERFEDVRAELQALLDDLARQDASFRYELRDLMRVDPLVGDPNGALARQVAGAARDALGVPPTFILSPGTYDQKHVVRRAGIAECIAYGPGRLHLAHQPDEYVAVEDLVAAVKVMALAAARLLGVAPRG